MEIEGDALAKHKKTKRYGSIYS
ncbi:hypothetical protein CBM2609_A110006 [Cupriavidus taiwanensis]|nr:hypothetical protein CBM2604_A90005 [Cupriavidus taiwanensis]SOZ23401.1 hypothetical protein CBM2609_A110006 [Cupriavidus taiwanensis]SOZ43818.1 hypothetical protein CBM2610_A110006 [Cupriavidus taiwanensis]